MQFFIMFLLCVNASLEVQEGVANSLSETDEVARDRVPVWTKKLIQDVAKLKGGVTILKHLVQGSLANDATSQLASLAKNGANAELAPQSAARSGDHEKALELTHHIASVEPTPTITPSLCKPDRNQDCTCDCAANPDLPPAANAQAKYWANVRSCTWQQTFQCYAQWHERQLKKLQSDFDLSGKCSPVQPIVYPLGHGLCDSMGLSIASFEAALVTGRLFMYMDHANWRKGFATPIPWGFSRYSKLFCPRNDSMEVEGADKWQHNKQDLELPMDEAPRFWLHSEAGLRGSALQLYGGKMYKYRYRDYEHGERFVGEFLKWMWAPNLEVKDAIDVMKSKVPKGNLLVGMHVRVMHTNVAGYYMAFWHCYQNLWKHLGVDKDTKMSVFIATDSQEVKDHLRELAGDSFLTNDIPIVHSSSGSGIVGAVDDLFSLAACDALILASKSTWTGRLKSLGNQDPKNIVALSGEKDDYPEFCGPFDTTGARKISHLGRRLYSE